MSGSQSPQTSRAGEAQRSRWSRTGLPVVLVVALCLVSFAAGTLRIGSIRTGRQAESTAVREARLIAEGQHRYGIVEYTRYPNGPTYALAAMMQLGLSRQQARLLPTAVSALCAGMLLWVLVAPSGPLLRTWATLALAALVLQPGIVDWQGALHEHSYAISTALLAMVLSCCLPARQVWVFSGLGFAAGWIGYDFLPAQGLAIFTLRWIYHCALRDRSLGAAFGRATLDALAFASGAAVAILTHLLQLALFFGSLSQAIRDLLGSAAARMGAEAAATMNPEYEEFLRRSATRLVGFGAWQGQFSPGRPQMVETIFRDFLTPRWIFATSLWAVAAAGVALVAFHLRSAERRARLRAATLRRPLLVLVVALCGTVAAPIAWILLMPRHAFFHLHMLPRHFFVAAALLVVLPVALSWHRRGEPGETAVGPSLLISFVVYAVPLLLVVATFAYGVVALQ